MSGPGSACQGQLGFVCVCVWVVLLLLVLGLGPRLVHPGPVGQLINHRAWRRLHACLHVRRRGDAMGVWQVGEKLLAMEARVLGEARYAQHARTIQQYIITALVGAGGRDWGPCEQEDN